MSLNCNWSQKSPSPPFRGEREGPAQREGELGGAANCVIAYREEGFGWGQSAAHPSPEEGE